MKGTRPPVPPWRRSTPFKGVAIAQIWRGQLHWQKWPRKRGRPTNPKLIEINEKFADAQALAKFADPAAHWLAIEIAKHGPIYPRDLHVSAMYGRLFEILNTDEGTFYSMALALDISADLDVLTGNQPGVMLVRGPDRWIAMIPGAAGQVVVSNGPDQPPSFQPTSGAGGRFWTTTSCANSNSGNNFNCKGTLIRPLSDYTVHQIDVRIQHGSAQDYIASVWRVNASFVIQELLCESARVTVPTGGFHFVELPMQVPGVMANGSTYYLGLRRPDVIDAANTGCARPANAVPWNGIKQDIFAFGGSEQRGARIAKANPQVGDTVANSGTLECWMGLTLAG